MLEATKDGDDPVELLQTAAREHIPVNPDAAKQENWSLPSPTVGIPSSTERDSIEEIIEEITVSEWYREQIVDRKVFEAKASRMGVLRHSTILLNTKSCYSGKLSEPLSSTIMEALQATRNISSLYIHQTLAIDALREGKNVIVSTSTASGKSVIYQVCPLVSCRNAFLIDPLTSFR